MKKEPREKKPITITLGRFIKLFKTGSEKNTDKDDILITLLGEAKNVLEKGKQDEGSRSKIYNCAKQDGTPSLDYEFVYDHYDEVVKRYYYANDRGEQAKRLRGRILEAWKFRLKKGLPKYEEYLEIFLTDYTLFNSSNDIVKEICDVVDQYRVATQVDDRAELLTILTLLSITRGSWENLPAELILPQTDKKIKEIERFSPEEYKYEEAKSAYEKHDYEKALKLLEDNLERPLRQSVNETIADVEVFNGKVLFLRSEVKREFLKSASDDEKERLRDDIKSDLNLAIEYGNRGAMLTAATEYYDDQPGNIYGKDWEKCKETCEKLIQKHSEAIEECGKATWMLYSMEVDESRKKKYLKTAAMVYSYEKAIQIYKKANAVSLINVIEKSLDQTEGIYYINDDNQYSYMIQKTQPEKWKYEEYPFRNKKDTDDLFERINSEWKICRIFLISDDFERNLRELLHFLQVIKNNQANAENGQFEFFIRGNEEKIAPFVDTALARIENLILPVHILDDSKMAASVLYQYPLFYQIRNLKERQYTTLKFVVVGNGPVCEWLVREAYWMLTFTKKSKIKTEIILLAPEAENVRSKILHKCPEIKLEEIKVIQTVGGYETEEFVKEINTLLKQEYVSFAIATGSDLDNMSLAIKIRELSIQTAIKKGNAENLTRNLPIIKFYCQDSDIANLSCRTVVINENSGEKWFNNYAVFPFGMLEQRYQWDALTNHILEEISLNVHLQYYIKDEFDITKESKKYKENYLAALKDYYSRTYNRDSSMAVAMSFPYRMFQGEINGKHILPFTGPLNTLDQNAFFSAEARENYIRCVRSADWKNAPYTREEFLQSSEVYKDKVKKEFFDERTEVYQLAEWEQERWRKFMISRGWSQAKEKDMKFYFDQGNKRQQLYIGKMHPCMIAFSELEVLEDKWRVLSGKNNGFRMNNITAIKNTEDILSLKWTEEVKKHFDMNGFLIKE